MFINAVGGVLMNCSCIKPVVIVFAIDEPAHNIIFTTEYTKTVWRNL